MFVKLKNDICVNINPDKKTVEVRASTEKEMEILDAEIDILKRMYPFHKFYITLNNKFKVDNLDVPLNEITKLKNHLNQNVKVLIQIKEMREIPTKNGKYMYIITASLPGRRKYLNVKMFSISPLTNLKEGNYYIANGKITAGDPRFIKKNQKKLGKNFDYYLQANSIEDFQFENKIDKHYEKSRAELHLHTKYSKNDAFIDIKDIEKAFDENKLHTAAMTDHGCVSAFVPFINSLKDKYKDTDKKLIPGCEFYAFSRNDYNKSVYKKISEAEMKKEELINSETLKEIENTDLKIKSLRNERNEAKKILNRKTTTAEEKEQAQIDYDRAVEEIKSYNDKLKELKKLGKEEENEVKRITLEIENLEKEYGQNNNLERDHLTVLLAYDDEEIDYRGEKIKINKGLVQLYKLISDSYSKNFSAPTEPEFKKQGKRPMLSYEEIFNPEIRKYFKVTSACAFGKHMKLAVEEKWDEFREWIRKLDAVEIQPSWNNSYMVTHEDYPNINSMEDVYVLHRKIYQVCKEEEIPCIVTSDAHVNDKEDRIFRANFKEGYITSIKKKVGEITENQVSGDSDFSIDKQPFIMSVDDVLEDYKKQGFTDEEIQELLDNTDKLADSCTNGFNITILPEKLFLPDFPNLDSKTEVPRIVWENAIKKWSKDGTKETIHPTIRARIEEELEAVAATGFEVLYMIAKWCCDQSNEMGYIVGSRGSAGSMIVSFLMDISENNPLPAHYYCKDCHHVEFVETDLVGLDLEDKICPECGCTMEGDGLNIEYFNFLG